MGCLALKLLLLALLSLGECAQGSAGHGGTGGARGWSVGRGCGARPGAPRGPGLLLGDPAGVGGLRTPAESGRGATGNQARTRPSGTRGVDPRLH